MRTTPLLFAVAAGFFGLAACSSASPTGSERTGVTSEALQGGFPRLKVDIDPAKGDWADALTLAQGVLATSPTSCDALYASLIATSMQVVDSINTFVLPTQRTGIPPTDPLPGEIYAGTLEQALELAQETAALGCEYNAPTVPLLIGDVSDPIVNGEIRETWTTRTALLIGALDSALLYDFQVLVAPQPEPPPAAGRTTTTARAGSRARATRSSSSRRVTTRTPSEATARASGSTTNTRAGFLSADIYSIDLATGLRKRLTSNMRWDEHAHLSPDGRKLAWISSRYQPAAVAALSDGSLSPIYDFLWIVPGIFFEFANPPAGYTTELTLADADGTTLQQLTSDNQVVADNQWSTDSRHIIYRQTDAITSTSRIRLLSFDDCE